MYSFLIRGYVFVIMGILLIGIGGVVSTFGWNNIDKNTKIRDLVISVVREWKINNNLLSDPLFISDSNEVLEVYRLYPRFKANAATSTIYSGLFSAKKEHDVKFLQLITDYELTIEDINARLDVSDNFILSAKDGNDIINHRKLIPDSNGFKAFKKVHKEMEKLLNIKFKWAFDEDYYKRK